MHVLDRITAYEKLGLGLFIHWGLYSQLSKGEWIFKFGKFSMDEYQKLSDTFTAEDFDADALVCFAKENGFKYIVLTTRHHDGFSLYDTCGLCDFDSPHSRANRDIVREFVDACNKHNVIPFLYHTTIDWYNSDYQNDFDTMWYVYVDEATRIERLKEGRGYTEEKCHEIMAKQLPEEVFRKECSTVIDNHLGISETENQIKTAVESLLSLY